MKRFIISLTLTLSALGAGAQSVPSVALPSDPAVLVLGGVGAQSMLAGGSAYAAENYMAGAVGGLYGMLAGASAGTWADGAMRAGAGFVSAGERLAYGVSAKGYFMPAYNLWTEDGYMDGQFTPKDISAVAGVSYQVNTHLSVGVTAGMVQSTLAPEARGTAYFGGVNAFWRTGRYDLGVRVSNAGTKMKYVITSDGSSLPLEVCVGGVFRPMSILQVSGEVGNGGALAGVLLKPSEYFRLSAGGHYAFNGNAPVPSYIAAGAGASVFGVNLDLAAVWNPTLGAMFGLGLGCRF